MTCECGHPQGQHRNGEGRCLILIQASTGKITVRKRCQCDKFKMRLPAVNPEPEPHHARD